MLFFLLISSLHHYSYWYTHHADKICGWRLEWRNACGLRRQLKGKVFANQNFNGFLKELNFVFSYSNPFQPSIAFHKGTSHLICTANQVTGFYTKCSSGLKLVKLKYFMVQNSLKIVILTLFLKGCYPFQSIWILYIYMKYVSYILICCSILICYMKYVSCILVCYSINVLLVSSKSAMFFIHFSKNSSFIKPIFDNIRLYFV